MCAALYLVFYAVQVVFTLRYDSYRGQRIAWALVMWGPILSVSLLVPVIATAFVMRRIGGSLTEAIFWPLGVLWTGDHSCGACALLWQLCFATRRIFKEQIWMSSSSCSYAVVCRSHKNTCKYRAC